jgi:hypothetical protein
MAITAAQVTSVLREQYPNSEIVFDPVGTTGRVSGLVVAKEFANLDFGARQEQIWSFLRERLGIDSLDISTVLAYSPDEYEEIRNAMG